MEHLDAKTTNFQPLNPLNPPYQGDFKKEYVSPKDYRMLWKRGRDKNGSTSLK